ncbi:hypothetical protein GIB67_014480 [Kingdonia uniflora]|uniref:Protein kinase domain-containing protein n=1 Tax=Kingdonia uniflora TaxID=39325 RepID=A0A7J7LZD2_9MAGN|nr:hypothetical protein GIB67_014480 [Kingdonia uniflora]
MEEFTYRDLQAATDNFSLSKLIGKGSHGCVYKAVLHGKKLVAVKKPSIGLQILKDNTKLDNEIDVLSSISRSSYIVNPVGLSHDSTVDKKLLVLEFMPNGSLHDLLHNVPTPLSWSKRALTALQVARAVHFLHKPKPTVIHRDIKPTNILFDTNWNARLADFGLAVRLNSSEHTESVSQPAGTIGYIDPSYTTPSKLSTKNDVFSFGVVLLEIISCRRAIDVGFEPACIINWALSLINHDKATDICDPRVVLPSNLKATIQCMITISARCVSLNEDSRPSMGEIVATLTQCMFEQVQTHSSVWRGILWRPFMRRRRSMCTMQEVHKSKRKLSIKEILADETQ